MKVGPAHREPHQVGEALRGSWARLTVRKGRAVRAGFLEKKFCSQV